MFNKVLGLKKIYFIHFHIGFNVKLQHIKRLQIKLSILGAGPFISRIKSYRLYVGILRTEQITKQFIKIRLRNKRATYKSFWHTMASHVVFVVDFQSKQKKTLQRTTHWTHPPNCGSTAQKFWLEIFKMQRFKEMMTMPHSELLKCNTWLSSNIFCNNFVVHITTYSRNSFIVRRV